MPLSWNEIKTRASAFSKRWHDAANEDSQAKPFLIDFFEVFGITDKRVATFEHAVKRYAKADSKQAQGFVDLFWPGILLVEMKSKGKSLDRAYDQAIDYFTGIQERDLPRYVLVCDFQRFRLQDLSTQTTIEFSLKELYQNVKAFGFIAGYQTQVIKAQDPINIKAAERMGKLHDALKAVGYEGHALEVYLVRLLFCLFAEDTTIFEKRLFQDYIETKTAEDGSDLAHHINSLFYTLNTAPDKRLKNLDEHLAAFPYVNGKLFEEPLPPAQFDKKMREALLDLCALDWSMISPAIFGSLFQSIMDADARRNLGAHYTSEENILKLIKPLFLDSLWAEFEKVKTNKNKLAEFHQKLSTLTFFDPACGCGNFLVITYRELRLLEIEVLRASHTSGQLVMDVQSLIRVDVNQFYGIEIEEFPAQIAQVALWLTDHQMNMRISDEFGNYFARIPLKSTPHIVNANALQQDWAEVLAPENCSYILGNPPFLGKSNQSAEQKADMQLVCGDIKNAGLLDFVAAWYVKAARYLNSPRPTAWREGRGVRGESMAVRDEDVAVRDENTVSNSAKSKRDPLLEEKLKAFARELRAHATDAEQRMWYILRDRRFFGFKFHRQHPIAGYILDFYCADAKLAIELDGGQHQQAHAYDQQRDATLQQQGINILRFWNNEFLQNPEGVLETITSHLHARPSPSIPLPAAQGEGSKENPSPHAWGEGQGEGKSHIKCAFVSTNSITQGEQVGVLWGWMLAQGIHIHFAHRTFSWSNEARGKAAVHCVIIGFYLPSSTLSGILSPQAGRGQGEGVLQKMIYEYDNIKGEPHAVRANNINPYLADAANLVIMPRTNPICRVSPMVNGSKPTDGGHLILSAEEKAALIAVEPTASAWIKPFAMGDEFINGIARYCLWLVDCPPQTLRAMPEVLKRVEAVKAMRLASTDATTRKDANTPTLFQKIRQPTSNYLALPRVSSERRTYIPIAYASSELIAGDKLQTIPNATLLEFGCITSIMHMAWMRTTAGRLKSDFQYSAKITYNNFPWPDFPSPHNLGRGAGGEGNNTSGERRNPKQMAIEAAAQAVLDARAAHPNASLADLYDPLTMPANLLKAHQTLDKAVDAAYGYKGAQTDTARVAFLFELYQKITSLLPVEKAKKRKR